MNIPWQDVEILLAVADTGSLSAAGRRLRVGQATVSRRLAQLEDSIGHALFHRGVEGATPTPTLERLLPAAQRMAESAGELQRLLEERNPRPEGVVRIAAAPGVAADFLTPFSVSLRKRHPGIRIELLSSIPHVNLARHEADLALRNQPPRQRELVELVRVTLPVRAFASRKYVKRLPQPPTLADIAWIAFAPPFERLPPRPQLEALIDGFEPAFTSDDFLVQWRAAELGLGAICLAGTQHRYQRSSTLVPIPIDLGVTATTYLVTAKTMLRVPRVRAVIDALVEELDLLEDAEVTRPAR